MIRWFPWQVGDLTFTSIALGSIAALLSGESAPSSPS